MEYVENDESLFTGSVVSCGEPHVKDEVDGAVEILQRHVDDDTDFN